MFSNLPKDNIEEWLPKCYIFKGYLKFQALFMSKSSVERNSYRVNFHVYKPSSHVGFVFSFFLFSIYIYIYIIQLWEVLRVTSCKIAKKLSSSPIYPPRNMLEQDPCRIKTFLKYIHLYLKNYCHREMLGYFHVLSFLDKIRCKLCRTTNK